MENLYTALAKANETIKNPGKDGRGNYGAYLTLDALLDAVRGPLAAQGVSITQDVHDDDERIYVTTRLVHASGETLTFGPMSSSRGTNIQHAGAAITYLRRFTLGAALGIAGEADDDGQSHADQVKDKPASSSTIKGGPASRAKATPKQVGLIWRLMKAHNFTEVTLNDAINGRYGWELPQAGLEALTMPQASDVIEYLNGLPKDKPIVRSKPTEPDPEDAWAGPITDPVTGEQVIL